LNFHDLGLNKTILRTLEEIDLMVPTPIQVQAIPPVLEGKDVVGLAQTGTGKTAAFLLPLLQRQIRDKHKGKFRPIRVLVLSPTRELAAQIYEKAREYGKSLNLRSQCTVGGIPIIRQQKALGRGADFLIATPGRLLDLVKRNAVKFDQIEAIVLDEADHMLDIGFLPDIKRIFSQLPIQRQTLLFSATMPASIRKLADEYLYEPVQISVARTASVAENIDQFVKHMPARQKPNELASILQAHADKRVVVFARTKHGSDKIVTRLRALNIEAVAIHGNKSQSQRERALKAFRNGDCKVLVATDIAARGIDIKDVGVVVNYELPSVPEVYVHRIGRTARAGSSGLAFAFCAPDETKHLYNIEKLIKITIPAEGEVIEATQSAGKKTNQRRFKKRVTPNKSSAKSDRDKRKPKSQQPTNNKSESKRRSDDIVEGSKSLSRKSKKDQSGSNSSKSKKPFRRRNRKSAKQNT